MYIQKMSLILTFILMNPQKGYRCVPLYVLCMKDEVSSFFSIITLQENVDTQIDNVISKGLPYLHCGTLKETDLTLMKTHKF